MKPGQMDGLSMHGRGQELHAKTSPEEKMAAARVIARLTEGDPETGSLVLDMLGLTETVRERRAHGSRGTSEQ